jgi:hypothetical protein
VIADRLDTLQKLREVLDHPYFSKYITRLVWDASYYGQLDDLEDYQDIFDKDPWRSSAIESYFESLKSYLSWWSSALGDDEDVESLPDYISDVDEDVDQYGYPLYL